MVVCKSDSSVLRWRSERQLYRLWRGAAERGTKNNKTANRKTGGKHGEGERSTKQQAKVNAVITEGVFKSLKHPGQKLTNTLPGFPEERSLNSFPDIQSSFEAVVKFRLHIWRKDDVFFSCW